MKKIFLLLLLSIFIFGCGEKKAPVLVMGTNDMFPPFAHLGGQYQDENIGFDIEFAKIIAKNYGAELKIEVMSFDTLISAVETGKVDMAICCITITEARKQIVDFSNSYFEAAQVAVVRADDLDKFVGINTKEQLGEMAKLSAQVGTTGAAAAKQIAGDNPVVELDTWGLALVELSSGNVDAAIIDRESARAFANKYHNVTELPITFDSEHYGVVVRKGNTKLLTSINKTINEIVSSGEYHRLVAEHIDTYMAE